MTTYQVRIAGKFLDAGSNFTMAVTRLKQEQARISEAVSRSEVDQIVIPSAVASAPENGRVIDEITRKDILEFIGWMRENLQVRVDGSENRTYKNKLGYLGTFLGRYSVQLKKKGNGQSATDPGLLYRSDIPKVVKKKPKKYDQSTIDTLLAKADVDEKDYLEFLLWSGFRDEEVQYLQFSDFNFRASTVMVQAKPHFGWKPKDYEEREITLPTPVLKRMKERMSRARQYRDGFRKATDSDLVFPKAQEGQTLT